MLFPPRHWHPLVRVPALVICVAVTFSAISGLIVWDLRSLPDDYAWYHVAWLLLNRAMLAAFGIAGCRFFMRPTAP